MQEIYYVYRKDDGSYQGSGTVFYDDETYGCTTVPCNPVFEDPGVWYWQDFEWIYVAA